MESVLTLWASRNVTYYSKSPIKKSTGFSQKKKSSLWCLVVTLVLPFNTMCRYSLTISLLHLLVEDPYEGFLLSFPRRTENSLTVSFGLEKVVPGTERLSSVARSEETSFVFLSDRWQPSWLRSPGFFWVRLSTRIFSTFPLLISVRKYCQLRTQMSILGTTLGDDRVLHLGESWIIRPLVVFTSDLLKTSTGLMFL